MRAFDIAAVLEGRAEPPPSRTVYSCDEHYELFMDELMKPAGTCVGDGVRDSWSYWVRSLIWRTFGVDLWPREERRPDGL